MGTVDPTGKFPIVIKTLQEMMGFVKTGDGITIGDPINPFDNLNLKAPTFSLTDVIYKLREEMKIVIDYGRSHKYVDGYRDAILFCIEILESEIAK